MSNKLQDQYYGNYRGIIKKHGTSGLCKIFVPGVYSENFAINIENLPWAEPCQPLFAGGALNNGVFQYPDIDSTVWLFFEAGNINLPRFFATTNASKTKFIEDIISIEYNNLKIILDSKNNKITISTEGSDGIVEIDASSFIVNAINTTVNSTNTNMNAENTNITSTNTSSIISAVLNNLVGNTNITGPAHVITAVEKVDINGINDGVYINGTKQVND